MGKIIDKPKGEFHWYEWTAAEARTWLKDNDYKVGPMTTEANYYAFAQRPKGDFTENMKTKMIGASSKPAGFDTSDPKGRPAKLTLGELKNPPKEGSSWDTYAVSFYHGKEDQGRASDPGGLIETRILGFAKGRVSRRSPDDAGAGAGPIIEGHGTVFNQWSDPIFDFVERFKPGSFKRTLAEAPDVRSFFNHERNIILGRTKNGTLILKEDQEGLAFEAHPPDTTQARDVCTLIDGGYVDQCSIQFICRRDEWSDLEGRPTRTILDADLLEVGPVTWAQYPQTDVQLRAFMNFMNIDVQAVGRAIAKRLAGQPTGETETRLIKQVVGILDMDGRSLADPGGPDQEARSGVQAGAAIAMRHRLHLLELET